MAEPNLWEQRLHPEDRDWVVAANAAAGDEWSVDYRSLRKDGSVVWIHNDARLIRDAAGSPLYWQGVVYDITERKRAEERLQDAEERYRTLIEQLPVAVYTDAVDDRSTALYISPQYEQLTGYSPEQRLLDPDLWVTMLHPEDRDRVLERSVETNETGEPFDIEYRIVAADGHTVWVHDHAMQVHDPSGQPGHGVLQDITEEGETPKRSRDAMPSSRQPASPRSVPARAVVARPSARGPARLGRAGQATAARSCEPSPVLGRARRVGRRRRGRRTPPGGRRHPRRIRLVGGGSSDGSSRCPRDADPRGGGHLPVDGRAPPRGSPLGPFAGGDPDLRRRSVGGYISFDHVDEGRRWSDADVEALSLTASTIGAAIERERAVRSLDEAQALYRTLIEQLPAVTYIEDMVR